jgi:hypothetical protein
LEYLGNACVQQRPDWSSERQRERKDAVPDTRRSVINASHFGRAGEEIILPNDIVLEAGRDQRFVFAAEIF